MTSEADNVPDCKQENDENQDVNVSEDFSSNEDSETDANKSPVFSSEGETSVRKRKAQSGEESNWSDGGSPTLMADDIDDRSEPSKTNWLPIAFILLVFGVGLTWLYFAGQPEISPSSHPMTGDIMNLMKMLNLSLPMQKNMMSTYAEMITNERPVVMMIVSSESDPESNPAVAQCFFKSQIDLFRKNFNSASEAQKISLRNLLSTTKGQCIEVTGETTTRCIANKFIETFKQQLRNSGVLWIEGLEALNNEPGLISSLNSFADHAEAPFKQSLIFMTASVEFDPKKPVSSVKSYFSKKWTKNAKGCKVGDISCLSMENFAAIWTRIGDFIIDSKSLSNVPEFCK